MTVEPIQPRRRTDRLAVAYYRAVNAASEEYIDTGRITDELAQSVETLSAAMTSSNMVGITARLTKIAAALDYLEMDDEA